MRIILNNDFVRTWSSMKGLALDGAGCFSDSDKSEYLTWVYDSTSNLLSSYCKWLTGNKDDADDLAQETYCRFYEYLYRVDQDATARAERIQNLSAYLCATARNSYRDRLRGERSSKRRATRENVPSADLQSDVKDWLCSGSDSHIIYLINQASIEQYRESQDAENERASLQQHWMILQRVLSRLSVEEQQVLWLRWGEGCSYREIAERLSMP